jgi:hypothetical protein
MQLPFVLQSVDDEAAVAPEPMMDKVDGEAPGPHRWPL